MPLAYNPAPMTPVGSKDEESSIEGLLLLDCSAVVLLKCFSDAA